MSFLWSKAASDRSASPILHFLVLMGCRVAMPVAMSSMRLVTEESEIFAGYFCPASRSGLRSREIPDSDGAGTRQLFRSVVMFTKSCRTMPELTRRSFPRNISRLLRLKFTTELFNQTAFSCQLFPEEVGRLKPRVSEEIVGFVLMTYAAGVSALGPASIRPGSRRGLGHCRLKVFVFFFSNRSSYLD